MTEHQQLRQELIDALRWECELDYMAGRCTRIEAWLGQLAVIWMYRSSLLE